MGGEKARAPYPAELRERAVRMVREPEGEHASRSAAVRLRWPARWAATARRLAAAQAPCAGRSGMTARVLGPRRKSVSVSGPWNARTVSCGKPTRS